MSWVEMRGGAMCGRWVIVTQLLCAELDQAAGERTRQPVLVVTIRGGVKAVTTSEHIYRIMKIVLDGVLFWCTL